MHITYMYLKLSQWFLLIYLSSAPVTVGAGFKFTSSSDQEGILALPFGADRSDCINKAALHRYAAKNADSWFQLANDVRGWETDNLYFVTGRDNCRFCGIASFSSFSRECQISLTFSVPGGKISPSCSYQWGSSMSANCCVSGDSQSDDATAHMNQSIFVRGFTISIQKRFLKLGRQTLNIRNSSEMTHRDISQLERQNRFRTSFSRYRL